MKTVSNLVCTRILKIRMLKQHKTRTMNKGGDTMDIDEMLDAVDSFVAGFGKREYADGQNALFIAINLFNLDLPFEFKGMGRRGVECLRLYRILRNAQPSQKNMEAFHIGETLAEYDSRELMLMALYLWNEGRSALTQEEMEKARGLLEKWKEIQPTEKAATASG